MTFLYQRGMYAKDKVTGFKGVITARMDHLTSCNQYFLKPSVGEDGKMIDGNWFDEHALEIDTTRQQLRLERTEAQPPG